MIVTAQIQNQPHSSTVRLFFGLTIGLGAALLFWQELLLGRLMLPKFGGVPAVWLVSLAVFQTILLLGYALAHAARRWRRGNILALLFVFVALAALQQIFLPGLRAPEHITPTAVIIALCGMAGCSLLLFSLISPVMQALYARLPQPDAHDPYFFYSASNFGSFAGLLIFPLALEPFLGVETSQSLWLIVFALFIMCLMMSLHLAQGSPEVKEEVAPATDARKRWPLWLFCAFLPSALSFGATSHLVNDIAPVPLLSMVPLALYLLTFVMAFGKGGSWQEKLVNVQPFFVALYMFRLIGSGLKPGNPFDLVIVLLVFFVTALKFHRQLAQSRPPAGDLTFFYLIIALGGALGAIVNVAVVPFVIAMPLEFALYLLIGLLPFFEGDVKKLAERTAWKSTTAIAVLVLITFVLSIVQAGDEKLHYITLPFLVVTLVAMTLRPSMMAIFSGILIVLGLMQMPHIVAMQRDFFGIKRVLEGEYPDGNFYRILYHGTTFHGGQQITPKVSLEPMFYYGKGGGFFDVMETFRARSIAIIGMGGASNACARAKDTSLRFFEIDPGMVDIAKNYFTFLRDCPADIVVGDGRLMLDKDSAQYDLIMLDAFSSDTIPVHLLTREAFAIYEKRLNPGGVITVHISNRYLDLRPVVQAIAQEYGWQTADKFFQPNPDEITLSASHYVALSKNSAFISALINGRGWKPLDTEAILWTDDKLSLVPVLNFFRKTPDAQTH
jgi:hypothetical protein